ncbi:hypothetical protein Ahy_B03g062580 [Arachis hypogaea]|uniref:PB1-like domain-containing protein n=1 Tax=Arachis hypogaea TaxID=3818 RepID=A0A444ZUR3_ARAHY|nr:hypothetical protein Ahy_B03g062580 [Arachis hypogaea]
MEERLDIIFHNGSDFKKNVEGIMIYSPDNKACLGYLDTNTLDVFFIRNYHKEFGYNDKKHCWWHVPEKGLDNVLRNVNSDKEIREMVNCARTNEKMIDVYFEYGVSVSEVLEGGNTVVYLDEDGGEWCNAKDTDVSPQLIETHALIVASTPKVVPSHSKTTVYTTFEVTQPPPVFCGEKGHTKRGCKKKRDADAAAAIEAAKKKKKDQDILCLSSLLSSPKTNPGLKRPSKLSPRRRSSLPPTSPTVKSLQGTSSAIATKFVNLMKFIPMPGFKPPRKKN